MTGGNAILKERDKVSITPMIDVVLLLLIYFMVATTFVPSEFELRYRLPSPSAHPPVELPEEYVIAVQEDGVVRLDGQKVGSAGDRKLPALRDILVGLRLHAAGIPGGRLTVTVAPQPAALQGRVIDVLNTLVEAEVKDVTFAAGAAGDNGGGG